MGVKNKIYFRVDCGNSIGLGHIVRCLALSEMLSSNFECWFVMRHPNDLIKNDVYAVGNKLICLLTDDEDEFINKLNGTEIVVIDGYGFGEALQKKIKNQGCKLVCIDDMNEQHFFADIVINHALMANENQYSIEKYTKLLLGKEYILVRKPFLDAAKNRTIRAMDFKNFFICMGGADKDNLTHYITSIIASFSCVESIRVVIGSAYLGDVEALKLFHSSIKIYQNVSPSEMVDLMQMSELGIVPASGISYECLAVGLPLIVGHYIQNQYAFYEALVSQTNIIGVGSLKEINKYNLERAIQKLKLNINQGSTYVVDGNQQARFLSAFNYLAAS